MIPIRCPHCHVGLKVDETKIPAGLSSFKCPKCKQSIPISYLTQSAKDSGGQTEIITPRSTNAGKLTVFSDAETNEQIFPLYEGTYIIGRKSSSEGADIPIITNDKTMSRRHAKIEVRKDDSGHYKHFLSDNNSKNHTLLNSNYLDNGEIAVLNDNDEIILGHTTMRFNC